jgi:putative DNA primase/helicase
MFVDEFAGGVADIEALNERLASCVQDWIEALLGPPDKRAGWEWRWGRKGSLRVFVAGSRAGSWNNFEASDGGKPLDLIVLEHEGDREAALRFARTIVGDETLAPDPEREQRRAEKAEAAAGQRAAEDYLKVARAQRMAAESIPIAGTPAERYLVSTRKIPKPEAWPGCVRYHRPSGSLLVIATNDEGKVRAIQKVHLTDRGKKVSDEEVTRRRLGAIKITNGVRHGAAVKLPGPADRPLLLCEGPETALSVWAATGLETHVTLGSLAGYQPPAITVNEHHRPIIVCRDMDEPNSPASLALNRMMAVWVKEHRKFAIAAPYAAFQSKGRKDFNDLIRSDGPVAVMDRIEMAVAPRPRVRRQPVAEARQTLKYEIGSFFGQAKLWDATIENAIPPVHGIRIDLGVGKSEEARRQAVGLLKDMRARGDQRSIVFAVPTLELAREQARLFNASDSEFTAETWHGRSADDPDVPGEKMCQNMAAVALAQEIKADVSSTCCRSREHGTECTFYHACGYQRQRAKRADVWFVAHELLFAQKPKAIGDLAALIVDESMWQSGLMTGPALSLPISAISPRDGDFEHIESVMERDLLIAARRKAVIALDQADGPITKRDLMAAGMTAQDAAAGILEWKRIVPTKLHPKSSARERDEARKSAEKNKTIPKLVMMWKAFELLLKTKDNEATSGWAAKAYDEDERPILKLKGRQDIRKGWQVPTLIMDATMDVDLLRPYWPQVKMVADIKVAAPHQRITQLDDDVFGKPSLMPQHDALGAPSTEKRRKREALRATLHTLAKQYAPGRVLVVLQKAIEETIGELPPNVVTAHHNAVAGRDEWRDVAALIVVGRTQPPPTAIEALAEALTGLAVTPIGGRRSSWYHPAVVEREMANGSLVYGIADRHHDPVAEAIRWQICDAELLQIIGRARGVNRTAANPVAVYVLTSTPIPVPLAKVISKADLDPTLAGRMLAAGGIVFENPTDAAAAYPGLFPNREAAKKAFERGGWGQTLYRVSSIGNVPNLGPYDYQLVGPGKKVARAWLPPAAAIDPAAALARLLGPLRFVRPNGN